MYRLVLYYLTGLVVAALAFSLLGWLPHSPVDLLFSTLVLLAVCWGVNTGIAKLVGATTNIESVYITAFILSLIISPVALSDLRGIGYLVFVAATAMASKYVLAYDKKHLFNPAALGVALAALLGVGYPTWWVGGYVALVPLVLVGGVLVVRKLRRFDLVIVFIGVALVSIALGNGQTNLPSALQTALLYTPLFFYAFVMLTEPITMPPTREHRLTYGALVGFFFATNIHFGTFYFSPELALLIGNLFSFVVSSKGRYTMRLVEKHNPVPVIDEFVFAPDRRVAFKPGQYLEWTLPHSPSDTRGIRRYFTIASSPTEEHVRLGIKFYEPTSSFKIALGKLDIGDTISASQVAGDFTLPRDTHKKLAFIAGGIGVTPFRSHVQYLIDIKDKRDVILLYASRPDEVVYRDLFDRAHAELGMKTVYISEIIDADRIRKEIPDYKERTFYISGPPSMVDAHKKTLRALGVSRLKIKTDYFPGFV